MIETFPFSLSFQTHLESHSTLRIPTSETYTMDVTLGPQGGGSGPAPTSDVEKGEEHESP